MYTNTTQNYELFDIADIVTPQPENRSAKMACDIHELAGIAMRFARVLRAPRYDCQSKENNAEHSFMVAFVADTIAETYFPYLDRRKVLTFGIVHDLPELITDDKHTFQLSDAEIALKEAEEHDSLPELYRAVPPYVARMVMQYELQDTDEAVFVRQVDKVLPVSVDLQGEGVWVMQNEYGVTAPTVLAARQRDRGEQLRRFFTDPQFAELHDVRDILADQFVDRFALEVS